MNRFIKEYHDTERIKACVLVLVDEKNILRFRYGGFLPIIQKDFDGVTAV